MNEEKTHARHASADDANVDFDCRPLRNEEVVPCRVDGLGKMDEGLKAEDADNCDTGKLVSLSCNLICSSNQG